MRDRSLDPCIYKLACPLSCANSSLSLLRCSFLLILFAKFTCPSCYLSLISKLYLLHLSSSFLGAVFILPSVPFCSLVHFFFFLAASSSGQEAPFSHTAFWDRSLAQRCLTFSACGPDERSQVCPWATGSYPRTRCSAGPVGHVEIACLPCQASVPGILFLIRKPNKNVA